MWAFWQLQSSRFRTFIKHPHPKKVATEQTESENKTVISAPTEAVTHGAVQVGEQVPQALLEVLAEPQTTTGFVMQTQRMVSSFLRTLFRVIISPNAP
ncbi:MAG: hypothetical protein HWD62_17065 [Cyclobacteriaceae bacterium]|nr:MAG: hypothetical protein HWD62_17065 [Cyclobacteriaceae bacterium]